MTPPPRPRRHLRESAPCLPLPRAPTGATPWSTTWSGGPRPTTGSSTCAWRPPPPRGRASAGCWWPPAAPAAPPSSWPGAAWTSPASTCPPRWWPSPRPSSGAAPEGPGGPGDRRGGPPESRGGPGDRRGSPGGSGPGCWSATSPPCPSRDGWADLVVALNASLNYLLEPAQVVAALSHMGRVAAPGGTVVVEPLSRRFVHDGWEPGRHVDRDGLRLDATYELEGDLVVERLRWTHRGRRGVRDLPPAPLRRRRAGGAGRRGRPPPGRAAADVAGRPGRAGPRAHPLGGPAGGLRRLARYAGAGVGWSRNRGGRRARE